VIDTLMIVNDKEDNDDDEEQEEDWAGNDAYQLHRAPHGRVLRLLEVTTGHPEVNLVAEVRIAAVGVAKIL
jgi:hypothetical protein